MKRTIYWTHFEKYQKCPQQFLWSYGWEGIDLGEGMGRRKTKPQRGSEHHLLMGTVTQAVLEAFYNDEVWHDAKGYRARMMDILRATFERELARRHIEWENSPSKEELFKVCEDGVLGYLDHTMKAHKLLGPWARSEFELRGWVKRQVEIACKVDFLIRGKDDLVMILEGKNSAYKDKYIDKDQVRWAALCYHLSYRKLPDKLAYLYWRFPYGFIAPGASAPEQGIEWIPFTIDDIKALAQRALRTGWAMRDKMFDPTPKPSVCRFCDFESVCSARAGQRSENAACRGRKKEVDDLGIGSEGFVDLDFGD